MFDKTINVKTIDLSGVNLPSDDEATCDLIYSALSTTYGFPIYMENFKVNGVKHDSVLVNPIISENHTIINLNDCHLIVTPTEISVGKGVYGASLESIVDKDGNLRFIGGAGSPMEITGITPVYSRWELSGGHLMLVYAFDTTESVSIGVSQTLCKFAVPKWVYDKLIVLWSLDAVELVTCKAVAFSTSFTEFNIVVTKDHNLLDFNNINQAITISANRHARIQVDLIVDTNAE